jgi:serine/threonine protein phosphatase PrpC
VTVKKLLGASHDPRRAIKALYATAMNASVRDNITIALV